MESFNIKQTDSASSAEMESESLESSETEPVLEGEQAPFGEEQVRAVIESFTPLEDEVLKSIYHIWNDFREQWTPSRLEKMTLEEYSAVGSKSSFTYMVERGTSAIGGIAGRSAFKFGIFARKSHEQKEAKGAFRYSEQYAWFAPFGESAERAFETVKQHILSLIDAVMAGSLDRIDEIPLDFRFKWKIAYLFQNIEQPCVIGLFKPEALSLWPKMDDLSVAQRHQALITLKPSQLDIHSYSNQLWRLYQTISGEDDSEVMESQSHLTGEAEDIVPGLQGVEANQAVSSDNDLHNEDEISSEEWLHSEGAELTDITLQFTDEPATEDLLGRKPFAAYLAYHLNQLWQHSNGFPEDDELTKQKKSQSTVNSFLINLYGQWGSGKTTFANMLLKQLQEEPSEPNGAWRVVEFNAWKEQGPHSVWWPLMDRIIRDLMRNENRSRRRLALNIRYWWWRLLPNWPYLLSAVILFIMAAAFHFNLAESNDWKGTLSLLTATLGAFSSLYGVMFLKNEKSAEIFKIRRRDPKEDIKHFFHDFVKQVERPIMVLIDDLDRCRPEYAVALLEHIHIVFNSPRIFFLVAADRHWIAHSFEVVYRDMGKEVNETGRTIGYSFIEKIFQMAISLPVVSETIQKEYLNILLQQGGASSPQESESDLALAEQMFSSAQTDEEVFKVEKDLLNNPEISRNVVDEMMLKHATKRSVEKSREHRISRYLSLITTNPRQMKLIVSAYGIYIYLYKDCNRDQQSYHYLDQVALWTIISVSFPRLAEYLNENPLQYAEMHKWSEATPDGVNLPDDVRLILKSAIVQRVLNGVTRADGEQARLDVDFLCDISGHHRLSPTANKPIYSD